MFVCVKKAKPSEELLLPVALTLKARLLFQKAEHGKCSAGSSSEETEKNLAGLKVFSDPSCSPRGDLFSWESRGGSAAACLSQDDCGSLHASSANLCAAGTVGSQMIPG